MAGGVIQGLFEPTRDILQLHVQGVRLFLRDFAEINQLNEGQETNDRMLVWSTTDFLSDFNQTPPFTNYTLDDLYRQYNASSFCVRGTVLTVCQSLMFMYARNHMPFSDGGIQVSLNDRAPLLMSQIQWLQSVYEQNKRMLKTAINVNQLLTDEAGGVHSDYAFNGALGMWG